MGTCKVDSTGKNDTLLRLSGIMLDSLDGDCTTEELSRRSYQSRTQLFRFFQALVEETPGAMRRRLLLERAAHQLINTATSVTEIAFDANYGSLEAFTRAFRKAFRVSPSLYRRMRTQHFHLPSPNRIHFLAPGSCMKGAIEMDLFDRFAGNDSWHTRKLLEYASKLTDEQLDRPMSIAVEILPWPWELPKTLRQLLENIIYTKEIWTAALGGAEVPNLNGTPMSERSPAAMLVRLEKTDAEFHRILRDVGNRGEWDATFVDALCEPAETFTFGGVFAHIMTFNAHRRLLALDALRQLGVQVRGFGDPIEYERKFAPWPSEQPVK
jgi:AraC family transcriptional regulator